MSLSDLAARLGGWPRRVLAVACLLLAGVTALAAHRPSTPRFDHSRPIVVAARDLPAGATLHAGDVRLRSWPAELRPTGALARTTDAVGRRVSGAIRAGEAITGTRLVGAGLTAGLPPSLRGVPVQISGGGYVQAGDVIDLLVADPADVGGGPAPPTALVLARAVRVLAVLGSAGGAGVDGDAVGIVVAVDDATALKLAAVSGRALVATVRDPP